MLLGIAVATGALVAACAVSLVLRPDAEMLRPIDGQSSGPGGERRADAECSPCGEATGRTTDSTSSEEGTAA